MFFFLVSVPELEVVEDPPLVEESERESVLMEEGNLASLFELIEAVELAAVLVGRGWLQLEHSPADWVEVERES